MTLPNIDIAFNRSLETFISAFWQRGLLNGSHDTISGQTYGQCWNLDATENWTGMKQAEGGSAWTLEQARTANPVNEITNITNTVGPPSVPKTKHVLLTL